MASSELIYINFTGGIVSPGLLKEVLELAAEAKVKNVRFGLRQQLILEVPAKYATTFVTSCSLKNIEVAKKKDARPNIVSSYPAVDIFTTDTWVREGVYKDIFNQFDFTPSHKINITDAHQSFVPLFTGHINWVSSASSHFWYLYVRLPKTEQVLCYPELIYTNDIGTVSKQIEDLLASHEIQNLNELFERIRSTSRSISKPIEQPLQLPKFSLPYYEGFNRHNNNYWLGIYRREELFPVQLLLNLCEICMKTKIGQIYTTPWKSIIIKGIETSDRHYWDYVLGKHRINVRHAANELNWQIEDNCEEGLQLKRQIIRYFDKEDVRTYGLSFGVKTKPFSKLPGSVIIRKQEVKNPDRLKALERFQILYVKDFNPNTSSLVSFRENIEKEHLGTYLVSLCKYFYHRESENMHMREENQIPAATVNTEKVNSKTIYQCQHCLTVYDEVLGDFENQISPNTSFDDLPSTYQCSLCEASKEELLLVER